MYIYEVSSHSTRRGGCVRINLAHDALYKLYKEIASAALKNNILNPYMIDFDSVTKKLLFEFEKPLLTEDAPILDFLYQLTNDIDDRRSDVLYFTIKCFDENGYLLSTVEIRTNSVKLVYENFKVYDSDNTEYFDYIWSKRFDRLMPTKNCIIKVSLNVYDEKTNTGKNLIETLVNGLLLLHDNTLKMHRDHSSDDLIFKSDTIHRNKKYNPNRTVNKSNQLPDMPMEALLSGITGYIRNNVNGIYKFDLTLVYYDFLTNTEIIVTQDNDEVYVKSTKINN